MFFLLIGGAERAVVDGDQASDSALFGFNNVFCGGEARAGSAQVVAHRMTRGLGIAQFGRERPLKQTLARAAGRRSLALQCRDCLHE